MFADDTLSLLRPFAAWIDTYRAFVDETPGEGADGAASSNEDGGKQANIGMRGK